MPTKRTPASPLPLDEQQDIRDRRSADTSGGALSTNEEYDPALDLWSTKSPMPIPLNWISAGVVTDRIYVMGGSDNYGGIFSLNQVMTLLTDTWSAKTQSPVARLAYGIGVVNNKIYVIGGWVRPGAPPGEPTGLNEEYDPQQTHDYQGSDAHLPETALVIAVAAIEYMLLVEYRLESMDQ